VSWGDSKRQGKRTNAFSMAKTSRFLIFEVSTGKDMPHDPEKAAKTNATHIIGGQAFADFRHFFLRSCKRENRGRVTLDIQTIAEKESSRRKRCLG